MAEKRTVKELEGNQVGGRETGCSLSIEWHKKRSRTNTNVDDNVYDNNDDADVDDDDDDDGDADVDDDDDVCLMANVVVYKLTFVLWGAVAAAACQ